MFKVDDTATIDELEQGLLAREALISELRQQQAEIIATLDTGQVNYLDGARSMQEWTRGRLDVSAQTARDLVDAARQLGAQPELAELAADNVISFERLIATSRLISAGADQQPVAESFGVVDSQEACAVQLVKIKMGDLISATQFNEVGESFFSKKIKKNEVNAIATAKKALRSLILPYLKIKKIAKAPMKAIPT